MTTRYEQQMYSDISRIRTALEDMAASLRLLAQCGAYFTPEDQKGPVTHQIPCNRLKNHLGPHSRLTQKTDSTV